MQQMTRRLLTASLGAAGALMAGAAMTGCASTSGPVSAQAPATPIDSTNPPVNTGLQTPVNPKDTAAPPPSGAAHSTVGVGTGVVSLGAGGATGGNQTASAIFPGNLVSNLGSDAYIVSAVDVANTGEIAEGMLARQRAVAPQARAFAQRMIDDHTKLQAADRALAQNPNFTATDSAQVTKQMQSMNQAQLVNLQQTPAGPAFDAMYMGYQITDHQNTLNLLNAAVKQARDDKLKAMLQGAIPIVQQHLQMAQQIQATLGRM